MFPPLFFQLQWHKLKRAVRVTKNSASDATKERAIATNNEVITAKPAEPRAADNQALSLPGISKIKLPEPPFPCLLESNTPPTELEATDILNAISMVEVQALHLQDIIEEHGPDRSVEHDLDLARQFVHVHRGILSAVRRIPPEVLQEIFFQINLPWRDHGWKTIPWVLSQVCQRWRAAALSMTILWDKFPSIHLHTTTPPSYVAKMKELLVRSRDAPIRFYLHALFEGWEFHPVIDALTRHSDRWQEVVITCLNLTRFTFKGVKGRLASLQSLSLDIWYQTEPVILDIFEDAPQLREVYFGGDFPGEIWLPVSQLSLYQERVRGRGMVGPTISLATSLTTLEITRFFESPDIPVTTLPFLVTLKVQFDIYRHGFLDRLILPVIEEIWITGYASSFITDIIDMVSHSHSPCILKKFAFRLSGLRELRSGELTRLLRLTPDLVALNLSLPPLEDLANLIIGENSLSLVPLLQTLTIEADAIRRPETSQLLNAIAFSRCKLQDSPTPAVPHLQGDRQALEELRIIFKSPAICQYELKFLEGWVPSANSEQLLIWKEKLLQELPELEGRPAPGQRKPDSKWCARVFDIFSEIENVHVKDVNDIYMSGMHIILRCFTNQLVTSIISQFGDRAREIIAKWTPLFDSHLMGRRWVLKGDYSLVYLSIDDPLRLSRAALDIVYGLKDDLQYSEIFWPAHMFS